MKFFLFHSALKNQDDRKKEELRLVINEPMHNTNEGGEFLDDAIRMKDQPLVHIEENIATAYPQGLL